MGATGALLSPHNSFDDAILSLRRIGRRRRTLSIIRLKHRRILTPTCLKLSGKTVLSVRGG